MVNNTINYTVAPAGAISQGKNIGIYVLIYDELFDKLIIRIPLPYINC